MPSSLKKLMKLGIHGITRAFKIYGRQKTTWGAGKSRRSKMSSCDTSSIGLKEAHDYESLQWLISLVVLGILHLVDKKRTKSTTSYHSQTTEVTNQDKERFDNASLGHKPANRWMSKNKVVALFCFIYFANGWLNNEEGKYHWDTRFNRNVPHRSPEDISSLIEKGVTEFYYRDQSRKVCVPLTMCPVGLLYCQPTKSRNPRVKTPQNKNVPSTIQHKERSGRRTLADTNKIAEKEKNNLHQETQDTPSSQEENNGSKLSCKNNEGNDVDWYFVYNLPSRRKIMEQGAKFYYMDDTLPSFIQPERLLNQPRQAVAYTLNQISVQPKPKQIHYLLYNDQPNGSNEEDFGHAKGVVAFSRDAGFWMIHSVPDFPQILGNQISYKWPDSAVLNGQSLLCVSFNSSEQRKIYEQLFQYIKPFVYFPVESRSSRRQLRDSPQQSHHKTYLVSQGGQTFTHFAKHRTFNTDLYMWVAEELCSNLYALTWRTCRCTAGPLNSYCDGQYTVENVCTTQFRESPEFSYTKEHSKWAISNDVNNEIKVICIGDLNRVKSQYLRGGGTMCADLSEVWQEYKNMVNTTEKCN